MTKSKNGMPKHTVFYSNHLHFMLFTLLQLPL